MSRDFEVYRFIFARIAAKYNHPEIDTLKNKDYIALSKKILEYTGISLSADTLKRLSGNRSNFNYKFSAQEDTKRAILNYAGFSSWEQVLDELNENNSQT